MTRDIPILFSAPMVQAILDGRKTQTRRALKPKLLPQEDIGLGLHRAEFPLRWRLGDRLWVKETWRVRKEFDRLPPSRLRQDTPIWYHADGSPPDPEIWGRVRSSIHMPQWASRITLLVTDVRVQRLQNISEADAIAEGMVWQDPTAEDLEWYAGYAEEHGFDPKASPMEGVWLAPGSRQGYGMTKAERDRPKWAPTARHAYRFTWEAINRPGSWDANPWVAAISFERVT